jgi:hypothetical protein
MPKAAEQADARDFWLRPLAKVIARCNERASKQNSNKQSNDV